MRQIARRLSAVTVFGAAFALLLSGSSSVGAQQAHAAPGEGPEASQGSASIELARRAKKRRKTKKNLDQCRSRMSKQQRLHGKAPARCNLAKGLGTGSRCFAGEQCNSGMCATEKNGKTYCSKVSQSSKTCTVIKSGWKSAWVTETCQGKDHVHPMCVGSYAPVATSGQTYGEACITNEQCSSSICVREYGSLAGTCGRYVNAKTPCKDDLLTVQMNSPDTAHVCAKKPYCSKK